MLKRLAGSALLLTLALVPGAPAPEAGPQGQREQVLSADYDTHPGATLRVDVPDADLVLQTGSDDQIAVAVWLQSRNMERARERYEEMNFQVNGDADLVEVTARSPHSSWWDWGSWGGLGLTVEITLPPRYDVDLKTSDGDVGVQRLEGNVRIRTSDGDIQADALAGTIRIRTSDGDVDIRHITGDSAEVGTSDGDITLGPVQVQEMDISTSDGDIVGASLVASRIELGTSDGDIVVDSVSGALQAHTSDGDIRIAIEKLGDSDLRTGDGDITIEAPRGLAAALDFRGHLQISDTSNFDGSLERRNARGALNGGGPMLRARTGDGRITLQLDGGN